ncbi:uncharacterized protein G2W53_026253 [Senna tora]|uniref:Uncharacterized protein n=1 Tax=Senna tora TaxID=362788 RepID=A0A834TEQ3_9FABA|nr:uncharacterized protein G2W53_026253 [Senna tora]
MLQLESSWHGRSVDHVLTYFGGQIAVGSQKPTRITRQKTCWASESNTSVRVVFANRSGFDAPIGVVLAWEEHGSCLNIFQTTNRGRISETFTSYEAKDLLCHESNTSVRVVFANRSGFDAPIGVVLAWEERGSCLNLFRTTNCGWILETFTNYEQNTCCASESNASVRIAFANRSGFDAPIGVFLAWKVRGSCLNIFRTTNRGQISETFTNYEAKDLLRKSVDHVLTYFRREIAVGSQKPLRITRQKTCCASESNTSVRVVFPNRSGFDAPIGVVLAWEERGSCLNIFRTTNHGRILETLTNYEVKDLLRKNLHELRGKRLVAQVSQTHRFALYFANRSCFDAPIEVVLAWEERGSCLNIFQTTNRGQILETFTNYEAQNLLRKSVDHVLTYSGRQIAVGSHKPSRITRQKTCCASELNTSFRVVFANRSAANRGRISETLTNYEAKDLLCESQKPSRITRQKTCCATESNTSVRLVFVNPSGFDAPIGVVLAWEERGSSLNIFRTTNRGWISEIFTNYEAKDLLASESNTSVRVVFANRSGFDAPFGVFFAWEERGSCLNVFQTTNRGRISETFTNYEANDLLRKNVDHVLTYSGRQIAVGSQKPSRITRQKPCCASESNTSIRVVFANWSGFDAPIGVVLAWEERGSCLNIFRTTNHGQISETFTNYKAKGLLRKQKTCCASESNTLVRVVFANRSGFDAPIGVVLAWEERGSCLNLFRTTNRGRISENFTNYEAKDLLRKSVDHVLTYFGRQIAVGSQKTSRITRQKTCCASESNTLVRVVFENWSGFDAPIGVVLAWEKCGSCLNIFRTTNRGQISETSRITRQNACCGSELNTSLCVVFANQSGFDAPIGVVLAWEERGSCLNIFRTTNRGQISKTFTYYEAKDCCVSESNTSVRVVFANRSGFDAPIGVVLAWDERGSCLNIFRTTNHSRISESFTNYEAKDLLRNQTRRFALYFGNRSGFNATIGVVLAWEECGSCVNIFRTTNRGRISETFMNYGKRLVAEAWEERGSFHNILETTNRGRISETFTNYGKRLVAQVSQTSRFALYLRTGVVLMMQLESSWHGRSVDHVLTYSGRQIAVESQKPSRITRQKTCCASESNTSVRVVLANRSGFDALIGVVLAWEERGSCLNIFQTTNRGRILETFTNYVAKDLLRKSVDHVLTNFEGQIAVGSQKPSRITRQFDAPIGVVLAWEERGSCLNIFRTTNRGRISETFTNYEAKDLLCNESNTSVRVVFANRSATNRGRISETFTNYEANTCCASESNTSVCVVYANRSCFDAPIGVLLVWEERGSCLNIFRTTNRCRISETFMNYEAKVLLRKSVDDVLIYSGRQIAVRSQKPSRITRQKTCCASESNTSVRVVFANRSGFDAPIGVSMAWEERE